jgi:scyllo-inositol 2-dehydrogenase (NADP+)
LVCGADDVDLVVIAAPNGSHAALAQAALTAGKHVVVDKPFVLSSRDGRRLADLAAARSRLLCIFQNRRFDGDFLAVKAALAQGELGDLLLFESRWDRYKAELSTGWRNAPGAGNGILWDLGSHLIDQAWQLFGAPDRWTADVVNQRAPSGADDYFEITLRYGRVRCILSASLSVAAARPRFAAHGTRASLTTQGLDPYEAALRGGGKPEDPRFRDSLPPILGWHTDTSGARAERSIPAGHWERFYAEVATGILEGTTPSSAAEHVIPTIALIEEIKAAAPGAIGRP